MVLADYYAVPLTAGQSSTIAVKGIGGHADIELYDGSGNLLALSDPSSHGVDGVISNFVAPATGTYYVKVTGAPGPAVRPGRDPRRRFRPSQRQLRHGPAA